jgi:D-alanyl-D-alanine endopeptidase (penicillin-binding protein 7)
LPVKKGIVAALLAAAVAFMGGNDAAAQRPKVSVKSDAVAKKSPKRVNVTYSKNGVRKAAGVAAAAAAPAASAAKAQEESGGWSVNGPELRSSSALVLDAIDGTTLFAKNTAQVSAIASITKVMTAMVVLDAELPLDESIRIERADIDTLKNTGSRLRIGSSFTRRDLLHLALMSSENRAASALGRNYPGGLGAFVAKMNAKAQELGMRSSRFVEPTGLSSENVSTADDLALMVRASLDYPLIRDFSTAPSAHVQTADTGQVYGFSNSNGLVRTASWQIDVSKTGYIAEAGQCLVMQARIKDRPVIIVLLDSWGKYTRIGDANRIKRWLEGTSLLAGHS